MRCPDCGSEVPEGLLLCPQCGLNIEQTQPMRRRKPRREPATALPEETIPLPVVAEAPKPPRPSLWRRVRVVLLAVLSFICILGIAGLVAGYTGYRQGERDRHEQRVALADEHYRRGLARLDAGEYELAIAEFEYALQLNPDHPLAAQGLAEAQVRLASRPTPTSEAVEDVAGRLYAEGTAAYQAGDWETAARTLSQLRAFAPGYETIAVEEMLFTSLYNHGMALLQENRLEEGIFYLDQALQIRPLDEAALWEREVASRYMAALGYWAVDWPECIRRFEGLYGMAPTYRDVFNRLVQAHVLYGDMWVEQGEMCPAAEQYTRALELRPDPTVEQHRADAAAICAIATPTPIPSITGTLPISGALVVEGWPGGRLTYTAYDPDAGLYDTYAILPDGQLVRVADGGDQPCWQWGSDRLIYRNRLTGAISMIQPGGQSVALLADARAAWPTFSPDGSRYAYALQDGAGNWEVYVARTDGAGDPLLIGPGWGPIWGPSGLLAWTGCENSEACGIFIDNPDDGEPAVRLTASMNDIALHWAPWGDRLAYMSNGTGSWDIYVLYTTGAVQLLTSDPTAEGLPAWSPDGGTMAFLSYRGERWGIYLMGADGSNVRPLLDLGTEMPSWQNQRLSWAP